MDYVCSFSRTKKGHDFVVVDKFNKMCILIPCKKTTKGKYVVNMFFENVWMHFGIPRSIISDKDTRFISALWTKIWEKMDTKLKRSKTLHPHTDGKA
jgi:hypothetical protein